ncbi:unnamed protein product [Brassica napus]|uniref:(rape) hypothetical protein n=1 Tax=Brassica napus TaxID=3708 RepID=A0A816KI24_BRANA|nr:unnamed protein product [Brassica napus]
MLVKIPNEFIRQKLVEQEIMAYWDFYVLCCTMECSACHNSPHYGLHPSLGSCSRCSL